MLHDHPPGTMAELVLGRHLVKALSPPMFQTDGKTGRVSWRRGWDSDFSGPLKTDNLLKNRGAQSSEISESAPNWNVTGKSLFVRPLGFGVW
jgi:hypothetical protein